MGRMNRSQGAIAALLAMCAGLIVAAVGGVGRSSGEFSGTMRIQEGRKECLAVRERGLREDSPPLDGDAAFEKAPASKPPERPIVSGDAIPFQEPASARNWIDPDADYEVAQLPFFVRVDRVEVLSRPAARDSIRVSGPDGERSEAVGVGESFALGDTRANVRAIRKWSGLLRDEEGRPMACVSVRQDEGPWSEPLFLWPGTWVRVGKDVGFVWQWMASETDAREAALAGVPQAGTPRWGVLDGGAVNWFASFAPGTGLELSDGTSVTLLEFREGGTEEGSGPAILVEVARGGRVERKWCAANDYSDTSLIRLDDPLRRKAVFVLFGWEDGEALAALYRYGRVDDTRLLARGEAWQPEGIGWGVRLEDGVSRAIPVKAEDSPFFEAVVEAEGTEVRVRQGEAVRWRDYLLRFVRDAAAPAVRYEVSLLGEGDAVLGSFSLGQGESVEWEGWRLEPGVADQRAPDVAVLTVSALVGRGLRVIGGVVALAGFGGLCLSLRLPRRARS